jgi:hypothetical protein
MERKPNRESNIEQLLFPDDDKDSAKDSLKMFFRDKRVVVPRDMILSDRAVSTVINTPFEEGFDYAHEHLLPRIPRDPNYYEPTMKWEVHNLLKLLANMRSLEIPKTHHPGLTLLYFHFCKGWDIPDPPPLS